MRSILHAQFATFEQAEEAAEQLHRQGLAKTKLVWRNPPGQHSQFPLGGDSLFDQGSKKIHKGALLGTAAGAILGLAVGPWGIQSLSLGYWSLALVTASSAYVGALFGALLRSSKKRRRAKSYGVVLKVKIYPGQNLATQELLSSRGAILNGEN